MEKLGFFTHDDRKSQGGLREAHHDAAGASSWVQKAVRWLNPLPCESEPGDHTYRHELGEFFVQFAEIRFNESKVRKLCCQPLPWPALEKRLAHSGANKIDQASRKKYVEWLFSSSEDCTEWIDQIPEELTFKTRVFPITLVEATAIVETYRMKALGGPAISRATTVTLRKLARKIDKLKEKEFRESPQIFIRLNPRSPKDGVMYPGCSRYTWLRMRVSEGMEEINRIQGTPIEIKHRKQALLASLAIQALAIETGEEAVDLLTNSERTFRDINQALQFPKLWDMKGIMRSFEPIPYHNEFRVFVYEGQITAISQYDHRLYFPELNTGDARERIQETITAFFRDEVRELLGSKSYIIDLGITQEGKVKVIELNPYEPTTGAAMFSWEDELKLLQGERDASEPVPIRVVKSADTPPPILFPDWEEHLVANLHALTREDATTTF